MLKIKNTNENGSEYTLENGIQLFLTDWNGEVYNPGYDPIKKKNVNNLYFPVYLKTQTDPE